jgi:hypothetical protein
VRDFSRLFSHSGGWCSCTKIVAVLMVLVEGQVVPVFGPMTRRSLCARRRGECRSRRPSRSKNQGVWGGDVRVERERGARVALNRPNEPGGPREWLVTPPDGVLIKSDLRRGFRRTVPGFSTKCEPAKLTRRMIDEARSSVPRLYFWAHSIKLNSTVSDAKAWRKSWSDAVQRPKVGSLGFQQLLKS